MYYYKIVLNKYICYCKAVMLRNKKIKSHLINSIGHDRKWDKRIGRLQ